MFITTITNKLFRQSWGLLIARIIIAGVFLMAAGFKFAGIGATATYISAAGFPFPLLLAWVAAIFEELVVLAFLSGVYMRDFVLLSFLYVPFLGLAFHGPSHWQANQDEFGFFTDHFTFAAGLLYMLAFGPGPIAWKKQNTLVHNQAQFVRSS